VSAKESEEPESINVGNFSTGIESEETLTIKELGFERAEALK
jgi:hypothetical protein